MTKEEREKRKAAMQKLRDEGKTHQQIGEAFGLSKQRVANIIGTSDARYFRYLHKENCIYNGLRDWMNYNKVSITHLARMMYENYHPKRCKYLSRKIKGEAILDKEAIDKIIAITGMKYEELFAVDKERKKSEE